MKAYRWSMELGPDAAALRRMRDRFTRPKEPMGEAWFLGDERRMFPALMASPPTLWPRRELVGALEELTSGPPSFGHRREWSEWFRYLLPRAMELGDEGGIFTSHAVLVSAVMVHCPDSDEWLDDYAGFRDDVLATLGRTLFVPQANRSCVLCSDRAPHVVAHAQEHHLLDPGDLFSASVFLVAKYLPVELLKDWLESVVAIDDPLWRATWVAWLAEAQPLLCEAGRVPADLRENSFQAGWGWCWSICGSAPSPDVDPDVVRTPFLREERRARLLDGIAACTTESRLAQWHEDLLRLESRTGVDLDAVLTAYTAAARQVRQAYALCV